MIVITAMGTGATDGNHESHGKEWASLRNAVAAAKIERTKIGAAIRCRGRGLDDRIIY